MVVALFSTSGGEGEGPVDGTISDDLANIAGR